MEQQTPTTPEQKPGSHYRKWSPRDLARLQRFNSMKLNHAQIAEKLERTPEAVSAMLIRVELSQRAAEYGRQTSILEQADEVAAPTERIEPHHAHVEGAHGVDDLQSEETPPEPPKTHEEAVHTVHVTEVENPAPNPFTTNYQWRERSTWGRLAEATRYQFTPRAVFLDPDPMFGPWEVMERNTYLFGWIEHVKERRAYLPPGHPDHPTYCRTFKAVKP